MLLPTPGRSALNPLSVMAPEPPIPPRQVLREVDLASRWGMSPKTLQGWRMEGRGPHDLKLGKRVNYPLNAMIAFENCVQFVAASQRPTTNQGRKKFFCLPYIWRNSALAHRLAEGLAQGLDQITQDRTFVGFDVHRSGHAGFEVDVAGFLGLQLQGLGADAHTVEKEWALARVFAQDVRADVVHGTFD